MTPEGSVLKACTDAPQSRQGYWNHRVVRYTEPDGTFAFGIHEAHYYMGEKTPYAVTQDATPVIAEGGNEMQETLNWMQQALSKPLIDFNTREEISSSGAIFEMNDIAKRQQ